MLLWGEIQREDQVEIIVGDVARVGGEDGAGPRPVEPDLLDVDPVQLELGPHETHEVAELDLEGGEVAAAVDRDDLVHEITESVDLLVREHGESLVLKVKKILALQQNNDALDKMIDSGKESWNKIKFNFMMED